LAIEIKAATKVNSSMLKGLQFWQKNQTKSSCVLLYGGNESKMATETINVAGWAEVVNL
jgi:hypothetical protein